ERRTEGGDTEVAQRDPELESAATAGQLQAPVGEVHLAFGRLDILEELRRDLEAAPQGGAVTDEKRAELDGLIQPLVRIERDRVGELHAGKRLTSALAETRKRAVCAVDVEPDSPLAAEVRQLFERVDGASCRGASFTHDPPRASPCGLSRR